ncbi:MAG TPA: hypothetical protein PK833_02560, partial [Vicingus sp.]|nr:hypothetical protein [Vicingus sp.]
MKKRILLLVSFFALLFVNAQNNKPREDKFKQLYEEFATPNVYRTASGAPGHQYYQQKADYVIDIELDDEK